jgi:hypothetical protein
MRSDSQQNMLYYYIYINKLINILKEEHICRVTLSITCSYHQNHTWICYIALLTLRGVLSRMQSTK